MKNKGYLFTVKKLTADESHKTMKMYPSVQNNEQRIRMNNGHSGFDRIGIGIRQELCY